MADVKDIDLIREFVDGGSEAAFAELVQRHINFVYSVALRYVGQAQDAQDVTQAVFTILAQKAASLRDRTTLTGWLYETTRFTGARLARTNARRHTREQKAFMQSTLDNSDTDVVWRQVAPLLEEAMARLGEKDRALLALRFSENKSVAETAALLGIQEWAASKRSTRALDKLRKFFAHHGIHSTTETLAGAISANSVQTAPVALAKIVTAAALAKSAATSGSTLTFAKAAFFALKTKAAVVTMTAAALIIGAGAYILAEATPRLPSASQDVAAPQFPNDAFAKDGGPTSDRFLVHIDPAARRTPDSAPAINVKYIAPDSPGSNENLRGACTIGCEVTNGSPFMGKHIRISCWLKTSNVQGWAALGMAILDKNNRCLARDIMNDRPVRGTTDWQQVEMVTEVPEKPCGIYFGPDLYSPGELWCDDFHIELVPATTPITDDRAWHVWNQNSFNYSETIDALNLHNGHLAVCLAYTPEGEAPAGSFMWWGQSIRDPDKYKGHTLRMTGWVKTENILRHLEPTLKVRAAGGKTLARDSMTDNTSLKGTCDWTQFSVTCAIPAKTDHIDMGFILWGSGKAWIDMDSIKSEITK
jgi:RNA polymerase sigma factor (sigma-70 family)